MEESSCDRALHPLLLVEILEVLFKKLPFEELKECRRVCRKWEAVSRNIVKKQSQLRLNGSIPRNLALEEYLRQGVHFFIPSKLKINVGRGFEEWKEEYDNWKAKDRKGDQKAVGNHSQHYYYYDWLYKGLEDICGILGLGQHSLDELQIEGQCCHHDFPPDRLHNILGQLSTTLKSLQIYQVGGSNSTDSTDEQILNSCPLLTKLTIGRAPFWNDWIPNSIFSVCPNLIEVNGTFQYQLSVLEKASEGLSKISGFSCSTQKDLELLGRKSGNLVELSLEVEEGVGQSVLEFVQSKKGSLTFLELKFKKIPETLRLGQGFSQLAKLHLKVKVRHICHFDNVGHYFVDEYGDYYPCEEEKQFLLNICFSKDTPLLKYFKLEAKECYKQAWKDMLAYRSNIAKGGRVIPQRTLTHLDLSLGVEGRVDRECADYLRQLFPSLTSIKIKRPTEEFLRGLWQMENLIHIDMDMLACYDYTEEYWDINDLGVALFGTPQEDQEVEESILNLKKLRYLRILRHSWNEDAFRILPDEILRNGFGRMKSLAVLKLPEFNVAPEGRQFLRANLPYLKELTMGFW